MLTLLYSYLSICTLILLCRITSSNLPRGFCGSFIGVSWVFLDLLKKNLTSFWPPSSAKAFLGKKQYAAISASLFHLDFP